MSTFLLDAYQGEEPKNISNDIKLALQSLLEQEARPEVAGELMVFLKKLDQFYP